MKLPLHLCFGYAAADRPHCADLDRHLAALRREGLITSWHEDQMLAGDLIGQQWAEHVQAADLLVLLLSADFLSSDACFALLRRVAEPQHEVGPEVIAVLVRPADWPAGILQGLEVLPSRGRPVSTWSNPDEAWQEVARGIRKRVERTQLAKAAALGLALPSAELVIRVWIEPAHLPVLTTRDISRMPRDQSGERFVLGSHVRIGFQANQSCHILLLDIGTTGARSVIYPVPSSPGLFPCAGTRCHYFPGPADAFDFVLSGATGRETLRVLASSNAAPQLTPAQINSWLEGAPPARWAEARCDFEILAA